MEFIHLSSKKIGSIRTPRTLGTGYKPQGSLWFACESAWEDWMAAEDFHPKKPYKYKYVAILNTEPLIILRTVADIQDFSETFAIPGTQFRSIDWTKVKHDTGKYGVYVVNAQLKTARRKYAWYSSFDVCSAVIWNKAAILSFQETEL